MIGCLASNDVAELITFEGELTIPKAMEGVRLNKLSTIIDKKNVIKAIAYLTARLSENFNVGKKFTVDQSTIMALDLFEVFGYETLEDVVLMFKYARQGKIGDGKDFKLDSQTVFHKWIPAYLELKALERENQHNKQKGEKSGLSNFKWSPEDVEKFEVSNSKETLTTKPVGLGQRSKKDFEAPGYVNPIKTRSKYIEALKDAVLVAPTFNLKDNLEYLKAKGNEDDAVDIIEKELKRRERKNP